MTRDEAFRDWYDYNAVGSPSQQKFAYEVWCAAWEESADKERDECAELCEELSPPKDPEGTYIDYFQGKRWAAKQLAEAIRARAR